VKREEKRESMIESRRVAMGRTVGVGEALGTAELGPLTVVLLYVLEFAFLSTNSGEW